MGKFNSLEITQLLDRVNWDFEDYISSSYPEDINSLHWYPASFVPQIPSTLIQIFSEKGKRVLDPFVGGGVTLIEAAKQNRAFIGVDFNPYAIEISKAKFEAINCNDWAWLDSFAEEVRQRNLIESPQHYCQRVGIKDEVFRWFHPQTLHELLAIHSCIMEVSNEFFLLKKVIFSSILKSCCSQRKHYTYITDRCFPKKFVRVHAKEKYVRQFDLARRASRRFREYYERLNSKKWHGEIGQIVVDDARDLSWINDEYVDLIVTSPPYLGCNDYIKSMRLTNLFFRLYEIRDLVAKEIGARCKRHRKSLQSEYLKDMMVSLNECKRVLRKDGHLALVFGQGKGRARKFDIVQFISKYIIEKLRFEAIFDTERNIMFHRIRFPGVKKEHIMVFRKL